ncbi:Uncharacterised protein [Mycobacterium tuberculosis]|uniref:Uncharacterized protein n=1 Tax=Mycobacterium tuberculosis TaxID=1773 RepID=A0A655ADC0_MYCTX|nr:Uncharacterised protein [Mycobacterium tuberculosis]CKP55022.1 Uncharacterised protein [Mycobacterium tuberculosis]CKP69468.1 Uncharacterised protein [Mycobacterium tuberculosis]CKS60994.1 Uncharacterised protein [Mycobacterium tuberculosis]CKS66167.1 Uncharacterised protein [Mycobacterium tuberculosis]
MSLSFARPILTAPGGNSPVNLPGRRIFIIDVARFPASVPPRAPAGGGAAVGGR